MAKKNASELLEYHTIGHICQKILNYIEEEKCTTADEVAKYVAYLATENENRRNQV
jgi:methionine aminopeptidase